MKISGTSKLLYVGLIRSNWNFKVILKRKKVKNAKLLKIA